MVASEEVSVEDVDRVVTRRAWLLPQPVKHQIKGALTHAVDLQITTFQIQRLKDSGKQWPPVGRFGARSYRDFE